MHLLVLEARFYDDIADEMIKGVERACTAAGATFDRLSVPGSYELPTALNFACQGSPIYDGYILLGCVIRGQTTHYDHICDAIFPKALDIAVQHNLAFGMGVLTTETYEQALERAKVDKKDYGGNAAKAALRMIALQKQFAVHEH